MGEVGGSWAASPGWWTAQRESVPSTPSISANCIHSGEPLHEGAFLSCRGSGTLVKGECVISFMTHTVVEAPGYAQQSSGRQGAGTRSVPKAGCS